MLCRRLEESKCGVRFLYTNRDGISTERIVPGLLYADDVVLMANTPEELQRMLNLCSKDAILRQRKYNLRKSNVMVFDPRPQPPPLPVFMLSDQVIEPTTSYKYLGITIDSTAAEPFAKVATKLIGRAKAESDKLSLLCGYHWGAGPNVQTKLYNAIIAPIYEYASAVWGPHVMNDGTLKINSVETHLNNYSRYVLHQSDFTAVAFLRGETCTRSASNHIHELSIRFFGGLCNTNNRMLSDVFQSRLQSSRRDSSRLNWCTRMKAVLEKYDFGEMYVNGRIPAEFENFTRFTTEARKRTNIKFFNEWREECQNGPSTAKLYHHIKSRFIKEQWIDKAGNNEGTWLKLQLRSGLLMTNDHLSSILRHKKSIHRWNPGCELCGAVNESPLHMLLECTDPQMTRLRNRFYEELNDATKAWDRTFTDRFHTMQSFHRFAIIAGGTPTEETEPTLHKLMSDDPKLILSIDRVCRNYLMLIWRHRGSIVGRREIEGRNTNTSIRTVPFINRYADRQHRSRLNDLRRSTIISPPTHSSNPFNESGPSTD
jgi:hypothetical protein